jgi:hypothetical protein
LIISLSMVDRLLAWAVIVLGALQCASTFHFYPRLEEPALWFFAGGLWLALVGALNLLRIREAGVPAVRTLSRVSNLVLSAFYLALYWSLFDKFAPRPASFLGPAVVLAATVISLRPRTSRAVSRRPAS